MPEYLTFPDVVLPIVSEATDHSSFESHFEGIISKVRPEWQLENLKFKPFVEGLTNQLFGFWTDEAEKISDSQDAIILRINGVGTEEVINREREILVWQQLEKAGAAVPLYASCQNGLCFGYCPGKTLVNDTISDPNVGKVVATELAKAHKLDMDEVPSLALNEDTRPAWVDNAENFLSKIKDFDSVIEKGAHPEAWYREQLEKIQNYQLKSKFNQKMVFCHNDLLSNNILYEFNQEKDGSDDIAHIIDYEYAGWNYPSFDIGNHFNEFTGTDVVDYVQYYPDEAARKAWIKNYLEAVVGEGEGSVSDEEVDDFSADTDVLVLASHLMWGVWSLFQNENSKLGDFDYLQYSIDRIQEMELRAGKLGML